MCEPTPISTIHSVATSIMLKTVTTSFAVTSTPSPVISTYTTSHCVIRADSGAIETDEDGSEGRYLSADKSSPSGAAEGEKDGDDGDRWRAIKWNHRERSKTGSYEVARAVSAIRSGITLSSTGALVSDLHDMHRYGVSPSLTEIPSKSGTAGATRETGTLGSSSSDWDGPAAKGPQFGTSLLVDNAVASPAHKRQRECSWVTSTSLTTITPEMQTVWQTRTETRTHYQTAVALETVYQSCAEPMSDGIVAVANSSVTSSATSSAVSSRFAEIKAQVANGDTGDSSSSTDLITDTGTCTRARDRTSLSIAISAGANAIAVLTPEASSAWYPPSSRTTSFPSASSTSFVLAVSSRPSLGSMLPTKSVARTLPGATEKPFASSFSADPPTGTHTIEQAQKTGTSKGVSAGVAIGGISVCCCSSQGYCSVRFAFFHWRKQQDNDEDIVYRDTRHTDEDDETPPVLRSRFSAPSLITRQSRLSRAVPAFLALPISHLRSGSGRFSNVFSDARKSSPGGRGSGAIPAWAESYNFPLDPGPPVPARMARDALSDDGRTILPRSPSSITHNQAISNSVAEVPRGGARILSTLSPPGSAEMLRSPDEEDWQPTRSNYRLYEPQPVQSYYSVYSTPSLYPPHERGVIGQAISAPGRESIETSSFRLPPLLGLRDSGVQARPAPNGRDLIPTRLDPQYPANSTPDMDGPSEVSREVGSSIFEYSTYDPRASHLTTLTANTVQTSHTAHTALTGTTRATQNWYDKPLWDSQLGNVYDDTAAVSRGNAQGTERTRGEGVREISGVSGVWTTGGASHDDARKSRAKSVRWEDEPLPKVFDLPRAV